MVKGVNFVDLRDAAIPVEAAIAYDAAGADELCFLDITASHENRGTIFDVVARTAEQCFMPLTIGGGVRTVEDVRALLLAGADKVSDQFRRRGATPTSWRGRRTGSASQCIVVGDRRQDRRAGQHRGRRWEVFTHGGRRATGIDAVEFAPHGGRAGRGRDPADLDGPRRHQAGLRHPADPRHRDAVPVPVIASGGVGTLDHLVEGVTRGPCRRRCSPPRSSTSATTPSPRPRRTWPPPAFP